MTRALKLSLLLLAGCHSPSALPVIEPREGVEVLVFERIVHAPIERVWQRMFSDAGYRQWTAAFFAGSYFEGTWQQGERMLFLAPGGSGMVSVVAANRQHELMSIQHLGMIQNGVEDTTSEAVTSWAPSFENYHFEVVDGGTRVTVQQETQPEGVAFLQSIWPKALHALAKLCES